jgi:hypothetical protein
LRQSRHDRDIIPTRRPSRGLSNGAGQRLGAGSGKEVAMAWISVLALMIGTMVTLSAFGAEINFRRSLDSHER